MGTVVDNATNRVVYDTASVITDDEIIVDVFDDDDSTTETAEQYVRCDAAQCSCGVDAGAPEIIDVVAQDDECAAVNIETANSTVRIIGGTLAITVRPGKAY